MVNLQSIQRTFQLYFNAKAPVVVRAPGRVNLIGEHTDYNEGFVLPMAIDHAVWIALRPRRNGRVFLYSQNLSSAANIDLLHLNKGEGWSEYIKGVAHELRAAGHAITGWEGVMISDVPTGAGLSSSAAVELAVARAFAAVSAIEWDAAHMAGLAQKAENEWVGVSCGIMDQMASAASVAGHALFMDCRTLETEPIPLPPGAAVVILDTSTRRGLVGSAYNERRAQCEAAARFFGVRALRDVSLAEFQSRQDGIAYQPVRRRARHIITENQRVLDAVEAMRQDDLQRLGELFDQSHVSLRDDYEVTNDALDQIVAAARAQPACYGARMTGAGFGGCAVALVQEDAVEEFSQATAAAYKANTSLEARIYVSKASAGASVEDCSLSPSYRPVVK
jgi:galactokinase